MRLTQTFSRQLRGLDALALAPVIALPAHGQRSQIRPQTATCSQMSAEPPHCGPAQLLIQPMARACATVGRTLPFRFGQLFLLRDLDGEQGSPQFESEVELLTQSTGAVIFSIDDFGQAIVLENTPRRVRARGNLNDVIDMQRSCLYRAQDAGRHDEIRMRLTRARGGTFDDVFQSSGLFAEWRLSVQTDTRLAVDTALCQPAPPRLVAAYNSGHLDNDGATAFSQLAFDTTLGNGESLLLLRNGLLVAQGPATGAGTRLATRWLQAAGPNFAQGCQVPTGVVAQQLSCGPPPVLVAGSSRSLSVSASPMPGSGAPILLSSLTPGVCNITQAGVISVPSQVAGGSVCPIAANKGGFFAAGVLHQSAVQAVLHLQIAALPQSHTKTRRPQEFST